MGTWGRAIFSDDTAADVRAAFREHIGNGLSAEEATRLLMAHHQIDPVEQENDAEDATFWMGLAATQWALGRLLETVKARTLRVIDAGADLELWEEDASPKDVAKRRLVLEKLKEQLLTPQPKPKKVKKIYRERTDWEIGHAVSYRLLTGRLVVLRVIAISEGKDRRPIVDLCDWVGDSPPDGATIASLPRLHTESLPIAIKNWLDAPLPSFGPEMPDFLREQNRASAEDPNYKQRGVDRIVADNGKMMLYRLSEVDLPADRVRVIGTNLPFAPCTREGMGSSVVNWKDLDMYLETRFNLR